MDYRALSLAVLLSIATAAEGQLAPPVRRCIDAYNLKLRLVSQQAGKSARACLRNAAKGSESDPDTWSWPTPTARSPARRPRCRRR